MSTPTTGQSARATALRSARNLHDIGRYAQAERVLRDLLATDPDDAEALTSLADCLRHRNDQAGAVRAAAAAVAAAPGNVEAHRQHAFSLSAAGWHNRAVAAADRALALSRTALTHGCRATVLEAAGRLAEAYPAAKEAVRLDPTNSGLLTLLGDILLAAGDVRGARHAYRRALRAAPDKPGGLGILAYTYEAGWRDGTAIRLYPQVIRDKPTNPYYPAALERALQRYPCRWALPGAVVAVVAAVAAAATPAPAVALAVAGIALHAALLTWAYRGVWRIQRHHRAAGDGRFARFASPLTVALVPFVLLALPPVVPLAAGPLALLVSILALACSFPGLFFLGVSTEQAAQRLGKRIRFRRELRTHRSTA
ncbi:tetratricopeptide repeat protein [Dactylosporangium sp. CA-092794]|uniref:tetratricopeptide repeat protein n=1 Tax=Dactylosporangium sp. CA-092794 TaxID=3239929 RepID=UPI003D94930D